MSREQWVFLNDCGCPFGVLENSHYTLGEAWREFYDQGTKGRTEKAIGAAAARGVQTVLVEHDRYVAEFYPRMRGEFVCPHQGGTG